jgi:hypothetical protein
VAGAITRKGAIATPTAEFVRLETIVNPWAIFLPLRPSLQNSC